MYEVCPYDPYILSSFRLNFHFGNKNASGKETYLSSGEMNLPLLYLYFSVSYLLCFAVWYSNIRLIQQGKAGHFAEEGQRPVVYHIHQLMTVLLILKFLSLFFESLRYHTINLTGHAEGWSFFYYTISFVKGVFLFTVIMLVGTGWSIVKPFLNDREKKTVLVVLILQVANNIAILALSRETQGESTYASWTFILHVVDIVCCCAVLIPIVWQVSQLEKSMGLEDADETDLAEKESALQGSDKADMLPKLKLFRTFYLMVIGYVYSTRILIYLFVSKLDYRHLWVQHFVIELITLAFYVSVGMMFRPVPDSTAYQSVMSDNEAPDELELQPTRKR
jgi:G protein-coupled receptor 107